MKVLGAEELKRILYELQEHREINESDIDAFVKTVERLLQRLE